MHKSLVALAVLGLCVSPATAQATPEPQAPATVVKTAPAAPPAAAQTVKKVVCERVVIEETTGSRLGSAPKRCRTIEVPAGSNRNADRAPSERG
jgi:hypothetical protein